ncbi:MAG TPA: D-alanyl-D-alanine carboxypeptidase/D-alanyl-D-alanine-endopeptidase [Bacteroidia bacterium]|nr:D-alanyl-D-alanine carboxypeptidase/D-alanyl-D-alanine-endopeptidase [Bacteroidia bacterium]
MKIKLYFLFSISFFAISAFSQQTVNEFINDLKKENELQNASISLCVVDVKTGLQVCEYNSKLSLTPASTMKIITTGSALQVLGKDFRYETLLQYSGTFDKTSGIINGDLYIKGCGDPSLNSEYFRKAEDTFYVANKWAAILKEKGIKKITGQLVIDNSCFEEDIPANWVWGDMGNYFGAAPSGLSYNDNKFYIVYKPAAKNGDSMFISKTVPQIDNLTINNYVKAGGTEDNAIVYRAPFGNDIKINGTLPVSTKPLSIEGSLPYPEQLLAKHLQQVFGTQNIELSNKTVLKVTAYTKKQYTKPLTTIYTYKSPSLEKIIFFTNLHSNNHYAESIFRTMALKKGGFGSTTQGIQTMTNHLKTKGFDANGLFINDGSGLSRSNAVTSENLTKILYMMYSDSLTKLPFANSLPIAGVSGSLRNMGKGTALENNLKAKSGYITRVRSYAGYMKTKSGKEICLSLIINNFNGTPSETKKKMEQIFLKIYDNY